MILSTIVAPVINLAFLLSALIARDIWSKAKRTIPASNEFIDAGISSCAMSAWEVSWPLFLILLIDIVVIVFLFKRKQKMIARGAIIGTIIFPGLPVLFFLPDILADLVSSGFNFISSC